MNSPPSATDDPVSVFAATRGQQSLRIIVWIILTAIVLVNIVHYLQTGRLTVITALPIAAILLLVLWCVHNGWLHAAFTLFLWGISIAAIATALLVAGFQSPGLLLLPLVAMLSGWLLPRRQTWVLFAVSVLGYLVIALLQQGGALPVQTRSPLFWALAFTAVSLLGTTLGMALMGSVRDQHRRALALSAKLREANATLEQRVAERTAELEATLDRLRKTQDDLIQSEKLASLGSLVAGIAHELNTPIGNTVTVSSALRERAAELQGMIEGGALKKSALLNGLIALQEMSALNEKSAQRAATLIASFKQVAIDQVSERRRSFDLRQMVDEVLEALRPGMKHKPWAIRNNVPPDIVCDSFPGPLGQVLTNLIQNAVLHGFAGREHGSIDIGAKLEDEMLELVVADDGNGMDTATALRIFEPFFTTKLGKGGSGLGLAICFRIVSTILAGEIRSQSSPGTGTQFIVRMPLRTPGKV